MVTAFLVRLDWAGVRIGWSSWDSSWDMILYPYSTLYVYSEYLAKDVSKVCK